MISAGASRPAMACEASRTALEISDRAAPEITQNMVAEMHRKLRPDARLCMAFPQIFSLLSDTVEAVAYSSSLACERGSDVRTWPILLQNDFWSWNEEQFSRT